MTSAAFTTTSPDTRSRPSPLIFCILAALVLLAYLPTLTQPLLEDDYPNIVQARVWGPVSGWPEMFRTPVFRLRATQYVLINGVYQLFGMHAPAYYAVMILLHTLNVWLIYALGIWPMLGFDLSAWAAAFFAVYEGHQEAIMWFSGSAEPLMLLFGLLSLLAWIAFLQRRGWPWYGASLIFFCLALLSKESAIILAPLIGIPLVFDRARWRYAALLAPFAALASLAVLSILQTRFYSFRFRDGSFSFHAPFWLIWPDNFARLFWVWGLLALIAIFIWRPRGYQRIVAIGMSWIGLSLIPYSFLTYSIHIPSRQLCLASLGLAWIVGFAALELYRRYWSSRRALVVAMCILILGENVTYLWTKKRSQFLQRAAPTEQLIALARTTSGPIYIKCFPRTQLIAESALQLMTGRPPSDLVWSESQAASRHATATLCYKDR